MSKECLAKTMVSVHRCHAWVAIAASIPVFFGKKTFAPDVYPSGRPWNVLWQALSTNAIACKTPLL